MLTGFRVKSVTKRLCHNGVRGASEGHPSQLRRHPSPAQSQPGKFVGTRCPHPARIHEKDSFEDLFLTSLPKLSSSARDYTITVTGSQRALRIAPRPSVREAVAEYHLSRCGVRVSAPLGHRRAHDGVGHPHHPHHGLDIVDTHDVCSPCDGHRHRRRRSLETVLRRKIQCQADEALS